MQKKKRLKKVISADFPFESKFINLGQDTIHLVESSEGDPLLLPIKPQFRIWVCGFFLCSLIFNNLNQSYIP